MDYDSIIIGGGVIGASTAWHLSESRKKVALLEQFEIANNWNASQDYTKAFRLVYADDIFYSRLAIESLPYWKKLEKESQTQLLFQCGLLLLAEKEGDFAFKSYEALQSIQAPVQFFNELELKNKYPQICSKFAVLDEQGGLISASDTVKAMLDLAVSRGLKILTGNKVLAVEGNTVFLSNNTSLRAEQIVLACNVWTPLLKPVPITPTRQQLGYFKPKNPANFTKANFPVFINMESGFYGFPMHGLAAVKISNHIPGEKAEPDDAEKRKTDAEFINSCRDFFAKHIPDLASAKLIKSKVALYDMTVNEDFIIDKLNDYTVVATGFSGHAFKFSPFLGKIIVDLLLKGKSDWDISRFRLKK